MRYRHFKMSNPTNKVFRLSRCPAAADETTLATLLSNALGDVGPTDIRVQSLARSHGLDGTSNTATLMFKKMPFLLRDWPHRTSWRIDLNDAAPLRDDELRGETLVLDTHFEGFTPLNDAKDDDDATE